MTGGSKFAITTQGEEAVAATTRETVLQLRAGSAIRGEIIAWGVSFDGTDPAAAAVVVDLEFQSTDGTASAATNAALDSTNPKTAVITGHRAFSAQPTAGNKLEQHEVHPQGGNLIREYPPDARPTFSNTRIGISVTAPAAVNVSAWIHWVE